MRPLYTPLFAGLAAFAGLGSEPTTPNRVPDDPDLGTLSWLVGAWTSDEGGKVVDEHWTHAAGGTMLGASRTVQGGKTAFFEFLRIEKTPEGIVYFAAPMGRHPPTPFRAVELAAGRVVFENREHDFPQRIIYTRESDDVIRARIEGTQAGKARAEEWLYRRAPVTPGQPRPG
ncbi:MAG: hypothetical protein HY763_07060 [Planctomycetes bacterium]|nr:hypothetical protein [Planctomycetota bacterium]